MDTPKSDGYSQKKPGFIIQKRSCQMLRNSARLYSQLNNLHSKWESYSRLPLYTFLCIIMTCENIAWHYAAQNPGHVQLRQGLHQLLLLRVWWLDWHIYVVLIHWDYSAASLFIVYEYQSASPSYTRGNLHNTVQSVGAICELLQSTKSRSYESRSGYGSKVIVPQQGTPSLQPQQTTKTTEISHTPTQTPQ